MAALCWGANIWEYVQQQWEIPVEEDIVILLGARSHSFIGEHIEHFQDNTLTLRNVMKFYWIECGNMPLVSNNCKYFFFAFS